MDFGNFNKKPSRSRLNKDWIDWWLADDAPLPTVKEELRRQRVKQAGVYTPRGLNPQPLAAAPAAADGADVKSVVINLHLPKLSSLTPTNANLNKFKKIKLSRRRLGIAAAVVLVLFLIKLNPSPAQTPQANTGSTPSAAQASQTAPTTGTIGSAKLASASTPSITQPKSGAATSVLSASVRTSPSFTPVAPASQQQLKSPTFGRTTYDSTGNVYTILDKFGSGPVTINETVLPAGTSAKDNADKINASQTISLSSGTAYLTTANSNGQQTAVLVVGNVIVYVNSLAPHNPTDWQTYLNNLK